ncbi:hypothetical protein AURDEDRAFT_155305 [Auricularia subglabra TFB-10046 SS5]|nr:hypothetical protein AURDEDRAFT_155305 [Auricularia subglabra TFB-10046 SS5]
MAPIYFLLDLAWSESKLAIPYLVPLALGALLLPLLALFSLGAGWMVWSSVPGGWKETIYLQYGDGIPHGEVFLRNLVADQAYSISFHLLVPSSPSNIELGNFMTTLLLTTASNKTVAAISRPSIIIPPTKSLFKGAPNTLTHTVTLLTNFIPTATRLLAYVEVGRKDGWRSIGRGEGRELSVLTAHLVGEVQLSGLRALIAKFPLTSTFIATVSFFAFSVAGMLAFTALYAYSAHAKHPTQLPSAPALPLITPKEAIEQPMPTPSTTSEGYSSSDSTTQEMVVVKAEPDDGPSTSTGTSQLRRRLSQDFGSFSDTD